MLVIAGPGFPAKEINLKALEGFLLVNSVGQSRAWFSEYSYRLSYVSPRHRKCGKLAWSHNPHKLIDAL